MKIYYGDGSVYEGDPWKAPRTDVQVIAQGGTLMHGKTLHGYYCLRDGAFFLCDDAGFWDYLLTQDGPKYVLFGRTMARTEDFYAILDRARKEL